MQLIERFLVANLERGETSVRKAPRDSLQPIAVVAESGWSDPETAGINFRTELFRGAGEGEIRGTATALLQFSAAYQETEWPTRKTDCSNAIRFGENSRSSYQLSWESESGRGTEQPTYRIAAPATVKAHRSGWVPCLRKEWTLAQTYIRKIGMATTARLFGAIQKFTPNQVRQTSAALPSPPRARSR